MSPDQSGATDGAADRTDRAERTPRTADAEAVTDAEAATDAARTEFDGSALVEAVERLSVGRRSILKAVGVGAAASLASGTATAESEPAARGVAASHTDGHERRIDPYYGYSSPNGDEELPAELQPDHEVSCLISFPGEGEMRPPYFYFDPVGLHVQPGDIVRFNLVTPDHAVTFYHPGFGRQQRVPDGVPPVSSPIISGGGFWLYEFTEPGLYDANCPPHEIFGMVVRILVGDPDPVPDWEGSFEGPGRPPETGPSLGELLGIDEWPMLSPAQVLDADALDPANVAAEGSVAWSDVTAELLSGGGDGGSEPTSYQVDFVAGEPIEELGEEGLYAEQDRLLRYAWGNTDEGVTDRGSAWASEDVRDCLESYGHVVLDDGRAHVTFTVADGCELTLSLAVHSLPGGEFSEATADEQELLDYTTRTYGPGEHTVSVDLPE
ncbi:cupredoxin domain-containing protein [Candidatus Halobonum tyrrellensis]|uniref:cupredoxin domain-containing protein n=1 Tax=Candidatus Halobonum tyrrellensis TaxID=1431545 RepID=UPI00190F3B96|nr:hypothetical protein [Candidatus Halobonum tyrrellensis]